MAEDSCKDRDRMRTTQYRAPDLARTLRGPPSPKMDFSNISFKPRAQLFPAASNPFVSAGPRTTLPGIPPHRYKPEPDFTKPEFWEEFGLYSGPKRQSRLPATPEPADIRETLNSWSSRLSGQDRLKCGAFLREADAQFSTLSAKTTQEGGHSTGKLESICSGSRATYGEEECVAVAVATAVDNIKRFFGETGCSGPGSLTEEKFTRMLIKLALSHPPPQESAGNSETVLRNGFYRAVAWCLCLHTRPEEVFSHIQGPETLSLIDCIGISAGVNTAEIPDRVSKELTFLILSKRWVSSAFSKMQENVRASASKGELHDMEMVELLETLFTELDRYQGTVQSFSRIAVLMHNLHRCCDGPEAPPLYLDSNSFYRLLSTRANPEGKVWQDLGRLHKLVSDKLSTSKFSSNEQHSAPKPSDIAYMFTTILEGLDFLLENPGIKDSAMRAMQNYNAMKSPSGSGAFREIFTMCMFTRMEDLERHGALYKSILNDADPINYVIALEHLGRISKISNPRESEAPRLSAEEIRAFAESEDAPF